MSILLIGASYRDISLDDLELLETKSEQLWDAVFTKNSKAHGINGGVLVRTCNRFEVYFDTDQPHRASQYILRKISEVTGLPSNNIQRYEGSEVTSHLFRVAVGLESMIVGEVEIAGQVKRALSQSQLLTNTTRGLEMLFQESARVSKKVATETGLGKAGRSLVTGGLDLLKQRNFTIEGKRVLVIGTGAYARVVTAALEREEVAEIFMYSTSGRAESFSLSHRTTPVLKDGLLHALSHVDFVVACSGTHGEIITSVDIQSLNKDVFPIIDLSLSRDIERSVKKLSNVLMIDLEDIYQNAPGEHLETIEDASSLIIKAVFAFEEKMRARNNNLFVKLMHNHRDSQLTEEFDHAFNIPVVQTTHG